jgi:hypothetical protein
MIVLSRILGDLICLFQKIEHTIVTKKSENAIMLSGPATNKKENVGRCHPPFRMLEGRIPSR